MKIFKTALALATAALLPLALFASPSSAVTGTPDTGDAANLYQDVSTSDHTHLSPPFNKDQQIGIQANFDGGATTVTLYRNTGGGWTSIDSKTSNSSGNAYFSYKVLAGNQDLYAETSGDVETEVDTITGEVPPPPDTNGTLAPLTGNGKTATAHFNVAHPGQATELQIQRTVTKETDEVNADPVTTKGPWVKIASGTQNATGDTTFNLPSPYPYRVSHKYRAVSGTTTTPSVDFGLGQVTPQSTGLAAVYFNTNENHSVDTRTHYFEGEFAMKAGAAGCGNVGYTDGSYTDKPLKESVMKGRGNYSWSFKRKSFTLKLGKATNICGMGISKKYALVSQDYDKSFLRNALAGYIGQKFDNMGWTPQSRPVDLYVNGSYRGNYLLIERIAIQGPKSNDPTDPPEKQLSPRLDLDELNSTSSDVTGGYIMEWDFRKGADYNAYLGSDSGYVGIKEPENDYGREGSSTGNGTNTGEGINSAEKSYISGYLNSADSALRGSSCQSTSWTNYIDQASAVDYYIAMEFMKPVDGNMWASVYMYKPRGDKIHFGPMWDFDLAAGSANRAGNVVSSSGFYLRNNLGVSAQQSSNTWFNCLNKRSSFRAAVKARWNDVKNSIDTNQFIDTQSAIIADSANTSYSVAPSGASHSYRISQYQTIKSSWSSDVSYLRSWASGRKSWLSSNF